MSKKKTNKTKKLSGLNFSNLTLSTSALHAFLSADLATQALLAVTGLVAFALWLAFRRNNES